MVSSIAFGSARSVVAWERCQPSRGARSEVPWVFHGKKHRENRWENMGDPRTEPLPCLITERYLRLNREDKGGSQIFPTTWWLWMIFDTCLILRACCIFEWTAERKHVVDKHMWNKFCEFFATITYLNLQIVFSRVCPGGRWVQLKIFGCMVADAMKIRSMGNGLVKSVPSPGIVLWSGVRK